MPFPEDCIRGISYAGQLLEPDVAGIGLFQFQEVERADDWDELSINWNDDDGAIESILNQEKEDGTPQFRIGAAYLSRERVDQAKADPAGKGRVAYERRALPDNPYHGNILLRRGTEKLIRRRIQHALALAVIAVHTRED